MEIGKRRIKIFGNSRIYDTDCDKITISKSMTLPGGYALPVAIIAEKCEGYIVTELSVSEDVAEDILQEYAKQIVAEELCAGEVLEFEHRIKSYDGYYCLEADFTCHEMISEILEGKWNEEDFQND